MGGFPSALPRPTDTHSYPTPRPYFFHSPALQHSVAACNTFGAHYTEAPLISMQWKSFSHTKKATCTISVKHCQSGRYYVICFCFILFSGFFRLMFSPQPAVSTTQAIIQYRIISGWVTVVIKVSEHNRGLPGEMLSLCDTLCCRFLALQT